MPKWVCSPGLRRRADRSRRMIDMYTIGVCTFKNRSQYKAGFYSTRAFAKKRMANLIKDHYRKSEISDKGGVEKITIYEIGESKY